MTTAPKQPASARAALEDGIALSVQQVSRWYPARRRWRPPRLLRWLPTSPVGGRGFDEDDLDDDIADYVEEGPSHSERGLREVSFDLPMGGGLALAGPDDIAKDALIRVLAGFVPPTSGRVLVRGRTSPLLTFYLTKFMRSSGREALFEIARFMGWPKALVRQRFEEIMKFARLNELSGLPPEVYTTVLTRRLVLSTALHVDAGLYLVGWRFSRDDTEFAEYCFDLLLARRREGAAVVYIGDLEEGARICDEAMWFEDGRVVRSGSMADVRRTVGESTAELEATLVAEEPVELEAGGGVIEFILAGATASFDLRLGLAIVASDRAERELWQPESFAAKRGETYRLTVGLPAGTLQQGRYEALLVGQVAGEQRRRELTAFSVTGVHERDVEPASPVAPGFEVQEVEWNVRRVGD
jgi:ABC-type polysaccharide/polyol phosphate transport system ATPase subunit